MGSDLSKMRIRFWGTRGSLPVALTTQALQAKLVRALVAASGKRLDTYEKARKFIEHQTLSDETGQPPA